MKKRKSGSARTPGGSANETAKKARGGPQNEPPGSPPKVQLDYINREISWLAFNERVLDEARDKKNPLLERVRFLAITCSNLDEFFMIRVASLQDLVHAGFDSPDPAGIPPGSQLRMISERAHSLVGRQYSTFSRVLQPLLIKEKIRLLSAADLTAAQCSFCNDYFQSTLFPILTPMGVDAARPFPLIGSKTLNLCVRIDRTRTNGTNGTGGADVADGQIDLAIVQVPTVVPRLVKLPSSDSQDFILLEDIIRMHIGDLFSGVQLGPAGVFRIMRNADLDLDEEEAADLLAEIEKQLKLRPWGEVIRLETGADFPDDLLQRLTGLLEIGEQDIYRIPGPLDLTCLNRLYGLPELSALRFAAYDGQPSPMLGGPDIFAAIRRKDILLHHPYESFDPVIELVRRAAEDPDVLAIKQTLYRVSGDSPIIRSLADAAERGKQVMVLVELKARFDEENNIQWARKLEQSGCHVIYGVIGLKTHSKIILVVRRDEDGIRRYVHLGTGNYNDITAAFYTDFGLLTCSESIGADASAFFNMLSGYSAPDIWRKLILAPYWLRRELERRIGQEILHARSGRKGRIIAKVNALVDPALIDLLYQASAGGVKIDLIVRGICCLRPGVPGLSENITVRSIVGRFLEHSRIFYFYNDGREELFLSSADWMQRNLDRRIELMFPVEAPQLRQKIIGVLELQLADTEKARLMQPDGEYIRIDRRGKPHLDSQMELCRLAEAAGHQQSRTPEYRFEPILTADQVEVLADSDLDSVMDDAVMSVKKSSGSTNLTSR